MVVHRRFTEAARAAALQIRRDKQARKAENPNPIEVFVVRDGIHYGWEIRQYGGVTIVKAAEAFETQRAARAAGDVALGALSVVRAG